MAISMPCAPSGSPPRTAEVHQAPEKSVVEVGQPLPTASGELTADTLGPWPAWRNRDRDPIPGIDSDSLSEDASSSDSDSSRSSDSKSSTAKSKRRRKDSRGRSKKKPPPAKKWRLKFAVHSRLRSELSAPSPHQLHEGIRRRRSFVVVPGLLSPQEIMLVHALFRHPSVEEIRDRKGGLDYKHIAYRMELPLRAHGQSVYRKLLDTMVWADARLWQRLPESKVVYPEAEYIVYDARKGVPGKIEPHVDNHSAVSIVVLLSDTSEFTGGINCFASADAGDAPVRQVQLQRGDAVVFRGEKLRHWIQPVKAGLRTILQIELSRI